MNLITGCAFSTLLNFVAAASVNTDWHAQIIPLVNDGISGYSGELFTYLFIIYFHRGR